MKKEKTLQNSLSTNRLYALE